MSVSPLCIVVEPNNGEMPERLKGHDWKSCVGSKSFTVGSNPTLSAMLVLIYQVVRCQKRG